MKRRKPSMMVVGVILCILGASLAARAQRTEGTIVGTVTDPSGASVKGARVIVKNSGTAETRDFTTDEIGFYRASALRVGFYEVRVEASGFKAAIAAKVEVSVNVVTRADFQLELGSLAQTTTVEVTTTLVQTEEGRLADTIDRRQVLELPLNGREVYQLVTLQPGVTATNAPVISNTVSPNSPVTFDFGFISNGSTPRSNNFMLDGTTNNNEWLGGTPVLFPSVDAIQELQVQTLNFSAEYGRNNGAVVNVITRSGTNELHGSVFYFHRNSALNARNTFDRIEKAPLLQHLFGVAVGAPIVKNKTFFFGTYEGSRRKDGQAELVTVETPEFRQLVATTRPGSFADLFLSNFPAPPCLPGTSRDTGSIAAPSGGSFAVGPLDGIPDVCDSTPSQVQASRANQYLLRLDHNFQEHDRLFVRWIANHAYADVSRQELLNANMRGFQSPLDGFFADLNIGYTHEFTPTWINDFRFAYSRNNSRIRFNVPDGTVRSQLDAAGTPDFFAHLSFDDGIIPFGGAIYIPRDFIFNTYSFVDTASQTIGRHSLRYGFEFRLILEDSNYELETRPFYEFNSIFNFANDQPWLTEALVNRDPTSSQFGEFSGTPREFTRKQWALFVQDDWKVLRNLALNLGVRYEVFGRPSEAQGRLNNVVLGSGNDFFTRLANATVGRVKELYEMDYNNFAPRIGLAWDPFGNGKMAVRSGFSVAFLEPYSNLYTNASRFDPPEATFIDVFPDFGVGTNINYTFPFQPSPDFTNPTSANGGVVGVNIFPSATLQNLRTAYSMQWFLGVQYEFLKDYAFSANYVGTRGVKLYIREDWNRFTGDICNATTCDFTENRLAPGWGGGLYASNASDSQYHGLNLQVRKNYNHSYMFVANYTFGKVLDLVTEGGLGDYFNTNDYGLGSYQGTVDVQNRSLDHGPSEFDVRHRFTFTSLWDLPSLKNRNAFVQKFFGGWQLNSIIALQSGRPFDVYCTLFWFAGCDFNMDGLRKDRPNAPAAGVTQSGWSNQQFLQGVFQVTDFCPNGLVPFFVDTPCVPVGTNGTLGRNSFRGPGFASVDLAIFKNTQITEKVKVQFRAEMFNAFNRVNLYIPIGSLSSPNFGRSTSAFAGRQIQFGLKFLF